MASSTRWPSPGQRTGPGWWLPLRARCSACGSLAGMGDDRGDERDPVVVRGSGDVGSAVAHRLFRAGYRVVIHDGPAPSAPRRGMAFTDAVFNGTAILEGVRARRLELP